MPKQFLKIAFRVDASIEIGTGHVMRCLTLAEALRQQAHECRFICRDHPGHLGDIIRQKGFALDLLAAPLHAEITVLSDQPTHAHWLGVPWSTDAEACCTILESFAPDWLVVDHYALDARWEKAVCPTNARLLVIDDLADREHLADVLLDQNLGREETDYVSRVPKSCCLLLGPKYALLRSEFTEWRKVSLARRQQPRLKRLLVNLGGVDKDNVTEQVLVALKRCDLPEDVEITVVMGGTAPWLNDVKARARKLLWSTEVVVNVDDMARRMAEVDLAIGAAGSTSWERCCMGLPTLMLVLADNQHDIAFHLGRSGASATLDISNLTYDLVNCVSKLRVSSVLQSMSARAANLVDGQGLTRVLQTIQPLSKALVP
ncbi:MAG: UDP-2,4-diacetamido-2,4,6-trideoxy-beta-L-altropyranose hydrolase [Gammaproteobacteria bacterium]|nr:UDP-2,4-diacetamido-2,4,6-trideoxy-beta-L-altropyranose hydrolase [Gammaproteobacteria bacterium]